MKIWTKNCRTWFSLQSCIECFFYFFGICFTFILYL